MEDLRVEVSINELMIKIKQLTKEVHRAEILLGENDKAVYDKETNGTVTVIIEPKDFKVLLTDYSDKLSILAGYKALLNKVNAETRVAECDNCTLQEIIIQIQTVRTKINTLESYCYKTKNIKRHETMSGASYFRVTDINYDVDEMKKLLDYNKEKLNTLDSILQTANANTKVLI